MSSITYINKVHVGDKLSGWQNSRAPYLPSIWQLKSAQTVQDVAMPLEDLSPPFSPIKWFQLRGICPEWPDAA